MTLTTLNAPDILARADGLLRDGWESDDDSCPGGKYCIRCLLAWASTTLQMKEFEERSAERSILETAQEVGELFASVATGRILPEDKPLDEARRFCAVHEDGEIRYDDRERTQRILRAARSAVEC